MLSENTGGSATSKKQEKEQKVLLAGRGILVLENEDLKGQIGNAEEKKKRIETKSNCENVETAEESKLILYINEYD